MHGCCFSLPYATVTMLEGPLCRFVRGSDQESLQVLPRAQLDCPAVLRLQNSVGPAVSLRETGRSSPNILHQRSMLLGHPVRLPHTREIAKKREVNIATHGRQSGIPAQPENSIDRVCV